MLDYSNRYLERMDHLKIQGYVKQITNRLDYTNAHCDARILREMNKDQGFIKMVRDGDFQKIADVFEHTMDLAEDLVEGGYSVSEGVVEMSKDEYITGNLASVYNSIMKWAKEKPDFIRQMRGIIRNYRQFLGNPNGSTRGGGWTAAKNAVAAMFRIEVVKEVRDRLEGYAKSEGGAEDSYRRTIDSSIESLKLHKENDNFKPFFDEVFYSDENANNEMYKLRTELSKAIADKKDNKNKEDKDKKEEDAEINRIKGCIAAAREKYKEYAVRCDDPYNGFVAVLTRKEAGSNPTKEEQIRLNAQIKFLQNYDGSVDLGKTLSNTDIGVIRSMAKLSYEIDAANIKSDHQDYANEAIREMTKDFYLPMKKLDNFKSGGKEK
jgi:hypothetical protein